MLNLTVWRNGHIATLPENPRPGADPWGLIREGVIITSADRIVWVGHEEQCSIALQHLMAESDDEEVLEEEDLCGALVTPGLIDCHTHAVYGGSRASEFEQRLQGVSYEEIARQGGGIRSTVSATRAISMENLLEASLARVKRMMRCGTTTLEVKSGYGLSLAHEIRCLQVARMIARELPIQVKATCLALHATGPEFEGRSDDYVRAVCEWLPEIAGQGLADAVDAFCERIAFSPQQVQQVFEVAKGLGLPVKLHAEQLSDQGGTQLAAQYQALSCDHLEYLSQAGVDAMAQAGTVAVLLPAAYYYLRETQLPPIEALRQAGVPMAVATDHNPGTSPCYSLPLMMNMACTLFRLTPLEAMHGVTVNAAKALGLNDRGRLCAGMRADMALWDVQHPRDLAYSIHAANATGLILGGQYVRC